MNGVKIAIGLIIFVVLVTSAFWYNRGKASVPPKLVVGTTEKACVEPTPYMRSSHMQLLSAWRDHAVRENQRVYVSSTGKKFDISLQNTCTKCHTKKAEFCDRCHNYMGVSPDCWNCHFTPAESKEFGRGNK
ncbi:MAG: sulfate reduction electron transfer complex DsrMKJOP subunit DsrJ [Desulfomonilaceae bacterium]